MNYVFQVDLGKVNIDVIKPWITCKLNDLLGMPNNHSMP